MKYDRQSCDRKLQRISGESEGKKDETLSRPFRSDELQGRIRRRENAG